MSILPQITGVHNKSRPFAIRSILFLVTSIIVPIVNDNPRNLHDMRRAKRVDATRNFVQFVYSMQWGEKYVRIIGVCRELCKKGYM